MVDKNIAKVAGDIKSLKIQGARNIALAGMHAIATWARKYKGDDYTRELKANCAHLEKQRATEPMLRKALRYMRRAKEPHEAAFAARVYESRMQNNYNRLIKAGANRINKGDTILVHCHSHTVIDILKKARKQGKKIKVYCTETRPRYQGRITAKELVNAGIPTTLIVDSAARSVMNDAQLVIIGADAVTADGFVVNKIGSSQIFALAKEARTMACVACETAKFDPDTLGGKWEKIEQRDQKEVWDKPPKKLKILNPAFDMVPPTLISFMITELGVINPFEVGSILREEMQ